MAGKLKRGTPEFAAAKAKAVAETKKRAASSSDGHFGGMTEENVTELCTDMVGEMLQEAAAERGTVTSLNPDVDTPYSDPTGRGHFYDATLHPPGSKIQSTATAFSSMPRLTEAEQEERLDWERSVYCGMCAADGLELDCGSIRAFEAHSESVHDGRAMWLNSMDPRAMVAARVAPSSAGGEVHISNADPLGRTIVCTTAAQARHEVERLGHSVADGPGAR